MINKAVFSFWSKPYYSENCTRQFGGFESEYHFLNSWILAVNQAAKFYDKIQLVTDSKGYELLAPLELPFTEIITPLDTLNNYHEEIWAIGKLYAYSIQEEPFIHIDSDLYLWEKADTNNDVIVQELENISSLYIPLLKLYINQIAREHVNLYVAKYMLNHGVDGLAFNCGVFGGNDIRFINQYANCALEICKVFNEFILNNFDQYIKNKYCSSLFMEQKLLNMMVCVEGKRDFQILNRLKFTHLLSTSKSLPHISARLINRTKHDYPHFTQRIK